MFKEHCFCLNMVEEFCNNCFNTEGTKQKNCFKLTEKEWHYFPPTFPKDQRESVTFCYCAVDKYFVCRIVKSYLSLLYCPVKTKRKKHIAIIIILDGTLFLCNTNFYITKTKISVSCPHMHTQYVPSCGTGVIKLVLLINNTTIMCLNLTECIYT